MSEPTLDDLRVAYRIFPEATTVSHRPLTPAEFDRIATEQGYVRETALVKRALDIFYEGGWVKRPVCGTCKGKPLAEGEYWDGYLPNGDEPDVDGPCPSCGGTGFGRLVAIPHDAVTVPGHYWIDGERVEDPSAAFVVVPLDALDGGQEYGV